jgi:hypothetical protein
MDEKTLKLTHNQVAEICVHIAALHYRVLILEKQRPEVARTHADYLGRSFFANLKGYESALDLSKEEIELLNDSLDGAINIGHRQIEGGIN